MADGAHGYLHLATPAVLRQIRTIRTATAALAYTLIVVALALMILSIGDETTHTLGLGLAAALGGIFTGGVALCAHLCHALLCGVADLVRPVLRHMEGIEAGEWHIANTLRAVVDEDDDDGDELGRRRSG